MHRYPNIREEIELYLDILVELYEATDPSKGEESQNNKLELARRAIAMWWYMYDRLLLWAQSQIIGHCMIQNNPKILQKIPSLDGDEIDEDSHELEFLGLGFAWNHPGYDSDPLREFEEATEGEDFALNTETLREIIAELLMARTANSSFWRMELQHALRALNVAEVQDLASPSKLKKQGTPYSLNQWKLQALREVYVRVGKGMKKGVAREEVGRQIGKSNETIRSWEKVLKRTEDYAVDLHCAQLAGEFEDELKSKSLIELDELYDVAFHRDTSVFAHASSILNSLKRHSLEDVKANIRRYSVKH